MNFVLGNLADGFIESSVERLALGLVELVALVVHNEVEHGALRQVGRYVHDMPPVFHAGAKSRVDWNLTPQFYERYKAANEYGPVSGSLCPTTQVRFGFRPQTRRTPWRPT